MPFFSDKNLHGRNIAPGVLLKSVYGDKTMLTIFDMEPHAGVPSHRHEHEQITYIIEGGMEFTLNGEVKIIRPGDGVVVPSNTEHSAKNLDKRTKVIDAWYPIREDYK